MLKRLRLTLRALILMLLVLAILWGCGPGSDDDDDQDDDHAADDDTADDDDDCGADDICSGLIDCGDPNPLEQCLDWFGDLDNCYDMPGLIECGCGCIEQPGCGGFLGCLSTCSTDYCPLMPPLPADPQAPGIPGQKDLPAIVSITVEDDTEGPRISGGGLEVKITLDPFGIEVLRSADKSRIVSSGSAAGSLGFAPIAFTQNDGAYWNHWYWGYRGYSGEDQPWSSSAKAIRYWQDADRVFFDIKIDDVQRGRTLFVVGPFYEDSVRLAVRVDSYDTFVNRLGFTFRSPADERYIGFGERFNGLDQRGKALETWLEEGGIEPGVLRPMLEQIIPDMTPEWVLPSGEDGSYCPIPFFLSNYGYGFLADVPEPNHFDLAKTHSDLWRIVVEGDTLQVVIFGGPTPADALAQYTERTGRSQVPRSWALAPWNMFVGYPGLSSLNVARIFREQDIPSSVTHSWTNITPSGSYRGSEQRIIDDNRTLHDLGYKSLCYLQPRIDKDDFPELWDEGAALDNFTRDINGASYVQTVFLNLINLTEFHVSHVDFTHEGVDDWWHGILQVLVDLDYDGTMYDFGEYTPPDAFFSDDRSGHYWHNPYPLVYQRSGYRFFSGFDDDPDDGLAPDYVYFHRSGYVGSQNWTYAMWSGDPNAGWSLSDGLPAQVSAGINVGLSGIPFWGSDIGGYHAYLTPAPTAELLKRWMEFGAFCGLMRDMTAPEISDGSRVLPLDEPDVTYVVRRYQKLRTQLIPYIANAAWEYRETGMPLMRALLLHFPDDPNVWEARWEYMFGPDLYVAPVVQEGATQRPLYLPKGEWVELWAKTEYDGDIAGSGTGGFRIGGEPIQGGRVITVDAPVDEIPLFVRMGAAIPLVDPRVDTFAPADPPPGYDVVTAEELADLLHIWAFPKSTTITTLADGSRLTVEETGSGVTLTRDAQADDAEVVAQVIWPEGLQIPTSVSGLAYVADADPLALEPGTWTWSGQRNAVALHGLPGQLAFEIR